MNIPQTWQLIANGFLSIQIQIIAVILQEKCGTEL